MAASIVSGLIVLAEVGGPHFGIVADRVPASPLAITAPLTITVMRSAMRNTASMSCSTSRIACAALQLGQQRQHALGFFGAHAGQRLVEQQHARARWPGTSRSSSWRLAPWLSVPAMRSRTSARPARVERLARRGVAGARSAATDCQIAHGRGVARLRREAAVLEHRELRKDRGALVAAADAGARARAAASSAVMSCAVERDAASRRRRSRPTAC